MEVVEEVNVEVDSVDEVDVEVDVCAEASSVEAVIGITGVIEIGMDMVAAVAAVVVVEAVEVMPLGTVAIEGI